MKLHDALRRSVRQFGISVLKEKRLVFVLSDYRAFDEYPAVREVMSAIYEEGFGPELFRLALDSEDDDSPYLNFARRLKDTLVSRRYFRREFVNYAIDSITLAIGLRDSVTEPRDSGFDAGKKDHHGPEGAPDQDDPAYIFAMGERYFHGIGTARDYGRAAGCYFKSAGDDYADAENALGWMYENGLGVRQDYAEAVKWYRKAAEQGSAEAENSLGHMYRNGYGVPQDLNKAVEWFYRAARQNHAAAQNNLGTMYMNGLGVMQDFAEARRWYILAARQNHTAAQYNLGCMYERGLGVAADDSWARKWFTLAANQGDAAARQKLAYLRGWGRLMRPFSFGRR